MSIVSRNSQVVVATFNSSITFEAQMSYCATWDLTRAAVRRDHNEQMLILYEQSNCFETITTLVISIRVSLVIKRGR